MVRIELTAYSAFRDGNFTACITEMLIEATEKGNKAIIKFDDDGAPLTYPLESKGKSIVEADGKIKKFSLGAFVDQAALLGYKTYVDFDEMEFGTIPALVGLETSWEAKKGKPRIDADGNTQEGYTNFILVAVKPAGSIPIVPATQVQVVPATPKVAAKPNLTPWKEFLTLNLIDTMNEKEIQVALNAAKKEHPDKKVMYEDMGKVRLISLKALVNEKFLAIDENLKYSLL